MIQTTELLNPAGGVARVRGNSELYARMLRMFLDGGEADSVEDALAEGKLAQAGDAAHALKGMTGNLEMPRLHELSGELCTALRAGERDEKLLWEWRECLEGTREEVRAYLARG